MSGSGKTTVLRALFWSSARYLGRGHLSYLALTEHHTQRTIPSEAAGEAAAFWLDG